MSRLLFSKVEWHFSYTHICQVLHNPENIVFSYFSFIFVCSVSFWWYFIKIFCSVINVIIFPLVNFVFKFSYTTYIKFSYTTCIYIFLYYLSNEIWVIIYISFKDYIFWIVTQPVNIEWLLCARHCSRKNRKMGIRW